MHEVFWRCARRAEDLSARLQLAELAIRLSPWRPDPWLIALRAALDGEADLGKGLPWARAAIRLYPKDREILALALRAKASFGDDQSLKETQAQLQGAAPLFDQASKLDRAHFHLACATSLERLGALDEALKDCRRALELNPQLNPARLLLATVLKKSGKTQEAEANLREHNIRTDPNETEIYLLTRQGPDRS
jgi:tetratricopeptide (TPR) repeat protein